MIDSQVVQTNFPGTLPTWQNLSQNFAGMKITVSHGSRVFAQPALLPKPLLNRYALQTTTNRPMEKRLKAVAQGPVNLSQPFESDSEHLQVEKDPDSWSVWVWTISDRKIPEARLNTSLTTACGLKEWNSSSWRKLTAFQQPEYPDANEISEVVQEIERMPPLVFAGGALAKSNFYSECGCCECAGRDGQPKLGDG